MGYLVPQRFQEMLTRAAELGQNRINSGMHSPLDVMGGRIQALAVVAYNLNKADTAALAQSAFEQAQARLMNQTGTSNFRELYDYAHGQNAGDRFANHLINRENFRYRMTYGFDPIASVSEPAVVPKGAEVLLATRFPCLSAEQRRVVLETTAWASGYPERLHGRHRAGRRHLGCAVADCARRRSVYVRSGTLHNASHEDLELPGSYTQLAGELVIELSEQLEGGLNIDGTAVIAGGKLSLRFSQGVPAAGTVVNVLRAPEVHGRFDQVSVEGASEIEVVYSGMGIAVRLKQLP
jgi:hypothetical protein